MTLPFAFFLRKNVGSIILLKLYLLLFFGCILDQQAFNYWRQNLLI